MKTQVFAVYDSKAEVFGSPVFQTNKGIAIRSFMGVLENKDSMITKHPADFTLFHLGEYDDATGKFTNLPTPESLGVAVEFVRCVERFVDPHPVEVVS